MGVRIGENRLKMGIFPFFMRLFLLFLSELRTILIYFLVFMRSKVAFAAGFLAIIICVLSFFISSFLVSALVEQSATA